MEQRNLNEPTLTQELSEREKQLSQEELIASLKKEVETLKQEQLNTKNEIKKNRDEFIDLVLKNNIKKEQPTQPQETPSPEDEEEKIYNLLLKNL